MERDERSNFNSKLKNFDLRVVTTIFAVSLVCIVVTGRNDVLISEVYRPIYFARHCRVNLVTSFEMIEMNLKSCGILVSSILLFNVFGCGMYVNGGEPARTGHLAGCLVGVFE